MNQILVAVDGSEHSSMVIDQACMLAKATSSSILLVFVMPKMTQEPEGVAAFEHAEGFPDAFSEYLEELGNRVTSKLTQKIEMAGISYRTITPSGNVSEEILNIAEAQNVSALVVGVKGLHGASRIRSLGSVSRRIIENSTRPVLVVP
jgi:nucleotide-binding universal stress UspA family protein